MTCMPMLHKSTTQLAKGSQAMVWIDRKGSSVQQEKEAASEQVIEEREMRHEESAFPRLIDGHLDDRETETTADPAGLSRVRLDT